MPTPIHTQARFKWPAQRPWLWGAALALLLLPALAMQFTHEVQWGREDFLVFGGMLLAACGAFELAMHLSASRRFRWVAGTAIVVVFLLVWAELAVGLWH